VYRPIDLPGPVARIAGALRFIDNELKNYFADSDTDHLTNALDTGLQGLHQALRRSFGYWQMGQDPGRWPPVVADLDLQPERRDKLTGKLLAALQGWVPGSRAQLRGSLGAGTADGYSDIDICWVVRDQDFTEAVDTLGAALSQCTAVLSLRTDPGFARSARRRVIFARLNGMPLFWRVDLDIRADPVATDDRDDAGTRDVRSEAGWSAPASAIENAVEAIKTAVRGQSDTADGLLRRGFKRIGRDPTPSVDLADMVTDLADACAAQEPRLATMAAEVREVADHLLRPARPGDDRSSGMTALTHWRSGYLSSSATPARRSPKPLPQIDQASDHRGRSDDGSAVPRCVVSGRRRRVRRRLVTQLVTQRQRPQRHFQRYGLLPATTRSG
jgi:hypothetical protein